MSPLDPSKPAALPRAPRPSSSGEPSPVTSAGPVDGTPPATVPPVLTALPSMGALWRATGRRWLLALTLGLTAAGLAGYGIWQVVPAPYVSELRLQLRRPEEKMPNRGDGGYEDFMRGQAALLKSSR